jgi:hypothetical protein
MASINAATSGGGGVITTSDATGNLNIQSGGSTVVAVTSAGVAVTGTLSATGGITGAAGSFTTVSATGTISKINSAATQDDFLAVSGSTTAAAYATVYNTTGALLFGIENSVGNNLFPGATAYAAVFGTQGNTPVHIAANNAIVATVSSTGLAVTGLVDISAATSGQIKFPATQNASANANTLDDYEEGTFTVTDQSGAGLTFSNNTGRYVKVGGLVYFAMDVIFPTTASVTNIALSLPFQSGTSCAFSAAVGYSNSGSIPSAYIGISQSSVSLYSTTGVAVTNVTFSGKELAISGCYPTT